MSLSFYLGLDLHLRLIHLDLNMSLLEKHAIKLKLLDFITGSNTTCRKKLEILTIRATLVGERLADQLALYNYTILHI